jgi:hypothetical protein
VADLALNRRAARVYRFRARPVPRNHPVVLARDRLAQFRVPLVDDLDAGLDQVEAGEEAGELVAGAQGEGDAGRLQLLGGGRRLLGG